MIIHVCNYQGGWDKGFVVALSRRYPEAERCYHDWYTGRIGCGLAGGDWETVARIITETLGAAGVSVTVDDLPEPHTGDAP